jgi:alpha-glucosidase
MRPWDADGLVAGVRDYAAAIPEHGWPNWTLGNHDMRRLSDRARAGQERVAAMLLLTLRGTPTIYYGDEIGMHNVPVPPEQAEDPQGKTQPHRSRDVARTPMQWDTSASAGFTTDDPWLPVASDFRRLNVAAQERDPQSLLNLYRDIIKLRRKEPALLTGTQRLVKRKAPTIAYLREGGGRRLLVLLNMAGDTFDFAVGDYGSRGRILLSTHSDGRQAEVQDEVRLRGNEGVIVALEDAK